MKGHIQKLIAITAAFGFPFFEKVMDKLANIALFH
jgi:hypothetical protein